jgi:hypothetical protein
MVIVRALCVVAVLGPMAAESTATIDAEALVNAMIAQDKKLVERRESLRYTLVTRREKLDRESKVVDSSEESTAMRGSQKIDYGTRPEAGNPEKDLERAAREEPFEFFNIIAHYTFTQEGEAAVHGQPCHLVAYEPKPGMPYRNREEKVLNHVRGRLWIRKSDRTLMRNEGRLIRPVSVAWFMATLGDLHFLFETRLLPNGDYGPARVTYQFKVNVLFAEIRERHVRMMSDYR